MDWTAIITAIIGMISAIVVAWIGHGVKKSSVQSAQSSSEVCSQIQQLRLELDDNNLRTMRLDLLHAIETDPDNVIVIMEMAQKYFVEMKGNCYMSKVFQEWANEHNVNITSLFNQG